MSIIAIDLGGTHLRMGTLHGELNITNVTTKRLPIYTTRDAGNIWNFIIDHVSNYCDLSGVAESTPIVFACPGPIYNERHLISAPTVVGTSSLDGSFFAEHLESATGRRTFLLNDVSAAAWFFSQFGIAQSGIVVTISSGIGAKAFDRNATRWVHDLSPTAGEIGHVTVDESADAPVCDCGERGHLSAIASGRAAERRARYMAAYDRETFTKSTIHSKLMIEPALIENETHLVPAALEGDAWACAIIKVGVDKLASALAIAVTAQGLESVVVMGGFATALGPLYTDWLKQRIDILTRGMLSNTVSVISATAFDHDWPALFGCGIFARMTNKI